MSKHKKNKNSEKKDKKREEEQMMKDYLETKWKKNVSYTCIHCLQRAYLSEINQTQGYVTDEELILCSGNKLMHM